MTVTKRPHVFDAARRVALPIPRCEQRLARQNRNRVRDDDGLRSGLAPTAEQRVSRTSIGRFVARERCWEESIRPGGRHGQ